jgi:1-phosphofructokinase
MKAPRIVTVSLNPAIDQTVCITGFTAGEVNRVAWEQSNAGGKGVNVASFLADFGHGVAVTGLLGEDNTDLFLRLFAQKNIVDRFVRVAGRTRVNVKIVDDRRNKVTDINFPSLVARTADLEAVVVEIEKLVDQGAEWFVLSGSLPEGLPVSCYGDLTQLLKSRGCRVVLDTSGPALGKGVEAGPDIVKPNISELMDLVGRSLPGEGHVADAARELRQSGIELVAVSMGKRGAIFVEDERAVLALPPEITVRSTVGAGDAMVAGIVHGQINQLTLEECARLATAFSLGALGEIGPRLPAHDEIERYRSGVVTRHLGD